MDWFGFNIKQSHSKLPPQKKEKLNLSESFQVGNGISWEPKIGGEISQGIGLGKKLSNKFNSRFDGQFAIPQS